MDKKAYQFLAVLFAVAFVVGAAFVMFGGSFGQQGLVDAEDAIDTEKADLRVCDTSFTPQVDVTTKNTSDPSIINLDGDVNATGIWKNSNNGNWEEFVTDQTISTDSTINLPTYEGVEYLLFFENISNNYFGKAYKGVVHCKGNDPITVSFEQVATLALKTFNNGNLGTENVAESADLAIGSGEAVDVILQLKPNEEFGWITADPSSYSGSLSAYAPPGPCVVEDSNTAALFQYVEPTAGERYGEVDEDLMLREHPMDANASSFKAFELQAATGITDFTLVNTLWKVKAQSGVDPTQENVLFSVYQPQLIKNRLITDPSKQWGWYCRDPYNGDAIIASSTERLNTS